MGLSRIEGLLRRSPLFPNFFSPSCLVALRTSPSSCSCTSRTLESFHSFQGRSSSVTMTMSLTFTFRFGVSHFCLRLILARYSFLHLPQNCSDRYCTALQHFLAYKSSLINLPGGGSGTEDFIVRRWLGVKGSKLFGSVIVSTVSGCLLIMDIAS